MKAFAVFLMAVGTEACVEDFTLFVNVVVIATFCKNKDSD